MLQSPDALLRNRNPVLIHHAQNQQERSQVGHINHPRQEYPDVRIEPLVLIQQYFMIDLHGKNQTNKNKSNKQIRTNQHKQNNTYR